MEKSIKEKFVADSYNNHKDKALGKYKQLKFPAGRKDCTEDKDFFPTYNFIRFKTAAQIEAGSYWIKFGGITNPLSF